MATFEASIVEAQSRPGSSCPSDRGADGSSLFVISVCAPPGLSSRGQQQLKTHCVGDARLLRHRVGPTVVQDPKLYCPVSRAGEPFLQTLFHLSAFPLREAAFFAKVFTTPCDSALKRFQP
jgi:hypothetical protein